MFSKPLLLATLATVYAADSTLSADTNAFASTDGCARCILKGQYWQFAAATSVRSSFTTVALAKASGTCSSSTNSAKPVELKYTAGSNYMELLIGACPYAQDTCEVTNQAGAASTSNMLTLDGPGKTGTLKMTGQTDGRKLTIAEGYCVWLIKATCGAPGFTINTTSTVMAAESSYNLYAVEYSKEFTTSASITLEDTDWFPKGLTSMKFYDNTVTTTSGNPGVIAYTKSTGEVYNIGGGALVDWNKWTEDTYDIYAKDLATYEAAVTAYAADKTLNRPINQPWTPPVKAVPVIAKTMFTTGYGKPTSQLVTATMKGKSFGVTAGTPGTATDNTAAMGVRFRREGTTTTQTTACDDSYIMVGAIMEVAGSTTNAVLQLDVVNNYWAGNITSTFDTLTTPTALPVEAEGASIMQVTGLISAATLAAFTLF